MGEDGNFIPSKTNIKGEEDSHGKQLK